MKPTLTISIRHVDKEIWWKFRALCALQGKPATTRIKELIEEAAREGGKDS